MMELPKNAPIKHVQSIEINAPASTVWTLMASIDHWPDWNPGITSAKLLGELKPGTRFKWKAGPGTIVSKLETVDPETTIGWSGKLPGISAVHIWHINGDGNSTTVTTEESWSGVIPTVFKAYSRRTLAKAVNDGLALLKEAAEE